jgi:hypothetical protein
VGGALLLLGAAELLTRLSEPAPLLFWLPTLWGGGCLVLAGVFRAGDRRLALSLIVGGTLVGFLPSAWTVIIPVLSVILVVRTARDLARAPNPSRA